MGKGIFISHSWKSQNEGDYVRLKSLLENRPYFNYTNYSVDSYNPLSDNVWIQIENKIRNSSVVIITAGVYATYSNSMQREIKIAQKYNKKILAVKPYGHQRYSSIAFECADEVVGHSTESIVAAVRRLT